MSKVITQHYVEFLFPGSFFNETSEHKVATRDPEKVKWQDGAFAFRFFDVTETKNGKETLSGRAKNYSGRYYKGKVYTLEELDKQFSGEDHSILRRNMRNNDHEAVIQTCLGNWQPFDRKKDKVLSDTDSAPKKSSRKRKV